jgi:hypothetical protein
MFKTLLIVLVFAVLMEDSLSIKKTAKEEKEDREVAEKVNATLAAEEEKKRKEDEDGKKKERTLDEKKKMKVDSGTGTVKKEDEASSSNSTCPETPSCPPCKRCPSIAPCPDIRECGPCPEVDNCQPCKDCPAPQECGPCDQCPEVPSPQANHTETSPTVCRCPGESGMSTPIAVVVGATASLVVVGLVGAVGLLVRYAPPFLSGFVIVATIIVTWYLSSHYPATARELGGHVVEVLREATATLSHRIVAALRHQNDQVVSLF